MKKIIYLCLLLTGIACKEKYVPPFMAPGKGYLVVDGVINSGQGPTTIRLSRSVPLSDNTSPVNETKAIVRVEGDNNSQYVLTEGSQGTYTAPQLNLNSNVKYRLYIKTSEGKEYVSAYSKPIKTPPIDNIRWEQPSDLTFFVNTHDPTNNIRYYRWEYEEVWEFHSAYLTQLKYKADQFGRYVAVDYLYPTQGFNFAISVCWQSERTSQLLFGSSIKLSRDSIDLPIHHIPRASWKIGVLYTILVQQNGVSKEGYEFLQRMKKNTESTGTLFDAQPSELVGNIHAVNATGEVVVGFMEVADVQNKRIWLRPSDLNNWNYSPGCLLTKVKNVPDSVQANLSLQPTTTAELSDRGDILYFYGTAPSCVDCTMLGTNNKPSFWP